MGTLESLKGKVVLVTGGATGIGKAIVLALIHEDATVIIASRNKDKLNKLADNIRLLHNKNLTVYVCDVTKEDQVINMYKKISNQFKKLDILINNSGVGGMSPTETLSGESWRKIIETNLNGCFYCAREAIKIMLKHKSGRIINMGSVSAKVPRTCSVAYAASKFALQGMTHALALEYRDRGINVSIIHPGNVWSNIASDLFKQEGAMQSDVIGNVVIYMLKMPAEVNFFESTIFTSSMPFLGRG